MVSRNAIFSKRSLISSFSFCCRGCRKQRLWSWNCVAPRVNVIMSSRVREVWSLGNVHLLPGHTGEEGVAETLLFVAHSYILSSYFAWFDVASRWRQIFGHTYGKGCFVFLSRLCRYSLTQPHNSILSLTNQIAMIHGSWFPGNRGGKLLRTSVSANIKQETKI